MTEKPPIRNESRVGLFALSQAMLGFMLAETVVRFPNGQRPLNFRSMHKPGRSQAEFFESFNEIDIPSGSSAYFEVEGETVLVKDFEETAFDRSHSIAWVGGKIYQNGDDYLSHNARKIRLERDGEDAETKEGIVFTFIDTKKAVNRSFSKQFKRAKRR